MHRDRLLLTSISSWEPMAPSPIDHQAQEGLQGGFPKCRLCLHYHSNLPIWTNRFHGLLQGCWTWSQEPIALIQCRGRGEQAQILQCGYSQGVLRLANLRSRCSALKCWRLSADSWATFGRLWESRGVDSSCDGIKMIYGWDEKSDFDGVLLLGNTSSIDLHCVETNKTILLWSNIHQLLPVNTSGREGSNKRWTPEIQPYK